MRTLLTLAALTMCFAVRAQSDADALRYSLLQYGGTARYLGAGGAFSAIGGDFTTLSINPAGIGLYRGNEFTFTPALYQARTTASFFNQQSTDRRYNFHFSNVGLVTSQLRKDEKNVVKEKGWIALNFGIGLN